MAQDFMGCAKNEDYDGKENITLEQEQLMPRHKTISI